MWNVSHDCEPFGQSLHQPPPPLSSAMSGITVITWRSPITFWASPFKVQSEAQLRDLREWSEKSLEMVNKARGTHVNGNGHRA